MTNSKYIRQINLPQIGEEGQELISKAQVLVVGAGGLGNAALPYLASTGIGHIGIIDGDIVSLHNLHRQVLYTENDIGKKKVDVAQQYLNKHFSDTKINAYPEHLNGDNALQLFKQYDIIIDATDNIRTRYLIDDACLLAKKPWVHAAVYRFQFQVTTLNVNGSATYRNLYKTPPKLSKSCAEAGAMPTTVAIAALTQVNEVFKYILNTGNLLLNQVLIVDILSNKQSVFSFQKQINTNITDDFFKEEYGTTEIIQMISFEKAQKQHGTFLDVREKGELPELYFKNYIQIPLSKINEPPIKIENTKKIFLFCHSGQRSQQAYQILKEKHYDVFCLFENAEQVLHKLKSKSTHEQ